MRQGRVGRRRSRKPPVAIGKVMGKVLGELGLDDARAAYEIGQQWEAAVGSDVAQHCKPLGLRQGVLELVVDSSVWAQQLQLRRPELLAALSQELGDAAPSDLRFRVGTLGGGPPGALR